MSDPAPRPMLGARHALALCVGVVIGAGIFRAPSLVAANSTDGAGFLAIWVAGGLLSIIGALCYAELAAAYRGVGGDYLYLRRAFGERVGFVYAWARLSVIQTGSIALLAFVCGDYLAAIMGRGPWLSTVLAAGVVVALTALNLAGTRAAAGAQLGLTLVEVGGLVLVAIAGLLFVPGAPAAAAAAPPPAGPAGALGVAMIFVLLTFGGWSETVYVTAELRGGPRRIAGVLVAGLAIVTAVFVAVNAAYLHALGLAGVAASQAVAADVMRLAFGAPGVAVIGAAVSVAALTSANATVITGARTGQALGIAAPALAWLGRWDHRRQAPANALLAQALIALALVLAGGIARDGFAAAVEYTAPVFWLAMLGVGLALFVLRVREPDRPRPFRVPLYPVLPLVFCATSAWLLWSSLVHTGAAALFGVGVLAAGALLSLFVRFDPEPQEPWTITPSR